MRKVDLNGTWHLEGTSPDGEVNALLYYILFLKQFLYS